MSVAKPAPVPMHERPLDQGFAWIVVASSFCTHFAVFGLVYSFGVFFLPIADEFNSTRADTSWIASVAIGVQLAASAVIGRIIDRFGTRILMVSGALGTGVGMVLTSYTTAMWQMYLTYGLIVGLSISFCFLPAVSAVQTWFYVKRGLATGLAVAGSGAGNFAFPFVLTPLIDSNGWRNTMRYEAAVVSAVVLLTSFTLPIRRDPHHEAPTRPSQPAASSPTAASSTESAPTERGESAIEMSPVGAPRATPSTKQPVRVKRMATFRDTVREVTQTKEFRLLVLANFIGSIGYGNPFFHIVPFGKDQGLSDSQASFVLSMFGVASMTGRVTLGTAADKLGRMNVLRCSVAVMGVTSILWPLVAKSFGVLIGYAVLYGFNAGAFVSLPAAIAADYFGSRNIGGLIGLLFLANAVPSVFGPVICGALFDRFGTYVTSGIVTGVSLLTAVLIWFFIPPLRLADEAGPESAVAEPTETVASAPSTSDPAPAPAPAGPPSDSMAREHMV